MNVAAPALSRPGRVRAQAARWLRPLGVALLLIGLEWVRALSVRSAPGSVLVLAVGGLALCTTGLGTAPGRLGLGVDRWSQRVLGGLALTVVLLLPAAVRWPGSPALQGGLAAAAVLISIGEEVAFRGVLFSLLEQWGGPLPAILGSSAAFAAAHLLSHPPQFLPAVFAAGLVLAVWRWVCRDLVGPVLAHTLSDLAL